MAGNRDLEQQPILSFQLYNVLENVGASEKMRKLHARTVKTWEILGNVTVYNTFRLHNLYAHVYMCGSTYEGSVTPDLRSDMDVIVCYNTNLLVVLDPCDSPPGKSLLMVRDEWTYPGYVKLQFMQNGCSLTRCNAIAHGAISLDEMGRLCVMHYPGVNMEGPADKKFDANGVHIIDHVPAFKCSTLPLFLRNRLELLKIRNLISEEECWKFNKMGCMFVGAGHFLSPEKEIEWRLSLSLLERHLMSKLNPTQHKVYILLKMIRKNIIEEVIDCKVLTSYHCKTCVLYAVEMTSVRAWNPGNLIQCLTQCIKLLIVWLKKGFCPNFFITDCNLFSKKGFSTKRNLILQTMELLLQTNNQFLTMLQTGHVGDILLEGFWLWKNVIACGKNEHIYFLKGLIITKVLVNFPTVLHRLSGSLYTPLSLKTALDSLKQIQNIGEHTTVETQAALEYLYPWFHLHIAKSLACLSYRCHNRTFNRQEMKVADFHFRKAGMADLVNVRLAKASVLYKSERYETCYRLLQEIDNEYTYKVTRICPCVRLVNYIGPDKRDKCDQLRIMSGMSVRKIMKTFCARCVMFLPSEFDIVPTPLQYEMFRSLGTQPGSRDEETEFWFDCSVIDAKVLLYFMQYLVSTKLQKIAHKQVAVSNILATITEDNIYGLQLGHKETAYNLLGWIYMQEQRHGDALQCLLKSWEIRPFHNAAKFHMRDLLGKMFERPQQRSC